MRNRIKFERMGFQALLLSLISATLMAQPPQLDHVVYGLFDYGCGAITFDDGISIEARKSDGTPIASFRIGSDVDLSNNFVLRIPMALSSGPGVAASGEVLDIVARSQDGTVLFTNSHQVSDSGTFGARDVGNGQGGDQAVAGPDQYICTLSTQLSGNHPIFGTGEWTLISGNGGLIAEPNNPNSEFSGQIGEDYQLQWTITSPSCPTSVDTVTISFSELMTPADAGEDMVICGNETQLAANWPLVGEGYWSVLSGGAGTFEDPFDPYTMFYGVAGTTYILQWQISSGSCEASADEVEIVLNAANSPDLLVDGPESIYCSQGATLVASEGFDHYQWSHGPTTRVVHVDGVGPTTYTVTGRMDNGCERIATHVVDFVPQNPDQVEIIVGMASYSICSQVGTPFTLSTLGACGGQAPFTFEWELISAPPEGGQIEDPTQPQTFLTPFGFGVYVVQLTVQDAQAQSFSVTIPLALPILEDNNGDGHLTQADWWYRLAAWGESTEGFPWLDADMNGTLNVQDLLWAYPCETGYASVAKTDEGGE